LSNLLGREGLSGFYPTYVSAPPKSILRSLQAASKAAETQNRSPRKGSARILGVHLEGPFLNPAFAGAHEKRFIRKPSWKEAKTWWEAAGPLLKIVTLAPETSGAMPVIRYLAAKGVKVQMGHSGATAPMAREAERAGASGVTHLFNAMGVELAEYALRSRTLMTEIIPDGVHVSRELLEYTLERRPRNKVVFVSDACAASGFAPGHRGKFSGKSVWTSPDGSIRRNDGTLAASGCIISHLKIPLKPS